MIPKTVGAIDAYTKQGDIIYHLGRMRDLIVRESIRPLDLLTMTMHPKVAARFLHWKSILKRRDRKRQRRRAKRGQKR